MLPIRRIARNRTTRRRRSAVHGTAEKHTACLLRCSSAGRFGAVLARAGVGKTALIVQIALNSLLCSKNVLHISLTEPVGKVNLWYQEVLERLAQQYQVPKMEKLYG